MNQLSAETSSVYSVIADKKVRVGRDVRKWLQLGIVAALFTSDFLLICVAGSLASVLRFGVPYTTTLSDILIVVLPLYFVAAIPLRAYRLGIIAYWLASCAKAMVALLIASCLTFTVAFAFQAGADYSRLQIGYLFVFASILIGLARMIFGLMIARSDVVRPRVAVLTDGQAVITKTKELPTIIDLGRRGWEPAKDDPHFLDMLSERLNEYDRVVMMFGDAETRNAWSDVMRRMALQAEVLDPSLSAMMPIGVGRFHSQPTIVISRGRLRLAERVVKRAFDLCCLLAAAPLLLPLAIVVAVAIKLDSRGPVLFVQRRVGRNNRQFACYKFRTMQVQATDSNGDRSAARDDERITRVGRILRKTSLDELPQLWNVLLGDMSLVGPRPHALGSRAEGALFWEATQGYWERHAVKPGITGLAQVRGYRGATHSRRDLELRVASDLEYINRWSLWLDLNILVRTVAVAIHRNAY